MTYPQEIAPRNLDDAPARGLALRIEGRIDERARGRIRDLEVVTEGGRIVLTGRSRTYYAKQLALQAAFDATDGIGRLVDRIVVLA